MLAPGGDTSGPFSAPAGTAAANVHGTGYLGLPLGVAPAPEGNSATAPTSPADSTAQTMRIIRLECTSPAFRGRAGPAFRGIGSAARPIVIDYLTGGPLSSCEHSGISQECPTVLRRFGGSTRAAESPSMAARSAFPKMRGSVVDTGRPASDHPTAPQMPTGSR